MTPDFFPILDDWGKFLKFKYIIWLWLSHERLQSSDLKSLPKAPLKTSLCLGLKDRPGALVDILLVFKAYGLNMTRIESRPSREELGYYYFYIDVEGDMTDPQYDRVWMYLEADTRFLKVLGPYQNLGLISDWDS